MVLSPHQIFNNKKRISYYSQGSKGGFIDRKIENWQQIIDSKINSDDCGNNYCNDGSMNRNEKLKANLMNYVQMNTGSPTQ